MLDSFQNKNGLESYSNMKLVSNDIFYSSAQNNVKYLEKSFQTCHATLILLLLVLEASSPDKYMLDSFQNGKGLEPYSNKRLVCNDIL